MKKKQYMLPTMEVEQINLTGMLMESPVIPTPPVGPANVPVIKAPVLGNDSVPVF